MIGNDIVDLNLAGTQCNWKQKRFLDKIFTKDEQSLILSSKDFFKMIWILWTMKESAYKINVRQTSKRFFNPKKLQCKLMSKTDGIVEVNGDRYTTKTQINRDYIFTIASLKDKKNLLNRTFKFDDNSYETQHKKSYEELTVAVSKERKIPRKQISIKKNNLGIPEIYYNDKKLPVSVSISHHGNYGAYTMMC